MSSHYVALLNMMLQAYIHNVFDSVSVAASCSVVFIKVLGKEPNPEEVKKTIIVLGLKNVAWLFTWSICVFALLCFSHNPKCRLGWMAPVPVQSVFGQLCRGVHRGVLSSPGDCGQSRGLRDVWSKGHSLDGALPAVWSAASCERPGRWRLTCHPWLTPALCMALPNIGLLVLTFPLCTCTSLSRSPHGDLRQTVLHLVLLVIFTPAISYNAFVSLPVPVHFLLFAGSWMVLYSTFVF